MADKFRDEFNDALMRILTPIITDTAALITDIVKEWSNALVPEGPNEKAGDYDDRYSFGLALNIRDLLVDVHCLYGNGRIRGIRLIARPILESTFNLDCSLNVKDFARTKSASEFTAHIERLQKWKQESKDRSGEAQLDLAIQTMQGNLDDLTRRFGTVKKEEWSVYDVAAKSRIPHHYRSTFFGYSVWTHVNHVSLPSEGDPEEANSTVMVIVLVSLQAVGMILDSKASLNSEGRQERLIVLLKESQRIQKSLI